MIQDRIGPIPICQLCVTRLSAELPAALSVGAHSSLVELADGGGFTVGRVVREEAAAALPAHTMEEVPETHQHTQCTFKQNCHSNSTLFTYGHMKPPQISQGPSTWS